MDVILLTKVENLGNLGDKVAVRPGYGRNYLIPSGRAMTVTPANLAKFEVQRAELEKATVEMLTASGMRTDALQALGAVTISAKAGEEGKLFGSVGAPDIAEALTAAGVPVDRHEVRLPYGPLRQVGEHEVAVHVHSDINVQIKVSITAEA